MEIGGARVVRAVSGILWVGAEERPSVPVRASRLGAVDGPREWWAGLVRTRTQGSGMVQRAAAVTRIMSRAVGWLMGS
jgi:hypothetical protein